MFSDVYDCPLTGLGENEPVYKSAEVPVNAVDNTYHVAGSEVSEGDKKALSTVAFMGTLVRTGKAKVS